MKIRDDFVAIILSHGRPDRVHTYKTLRKTGYTGAILVIVDDMDPTREEYVKQYGEEVVIFDKRAIGRTFDRGDNFENYRSTNYARNASFDIARSRGFNYFIQLDDDYTDFRFRFNDKCDYGPRKCRSLDTIFSAMLNFFISSGVSSVAMAQGGDFIGGENSWFAEAVRMKRKCMNSFICSTDRRFTFLGRLNEDVNTYCRLGNIGHIFFTVNQVCLEQIQTQANAGGMTEAYLESGTYVKSFYTVMFQPSSVKVYVIRDRGSWRLHHNIKWKNTVPVILRETVKKNA